MDGGLGIRLSLRLPALLVAVVLTSVPVFAQVAEIQAILIDGVAQTEVTDVTRLEIKRIEDARLESGSVGTKLFTGDEVRTGAGVVVSIIFTGHNSRIEVFVQDKSRAAIGSLFSYYGRYLIRGLGIFDTQTSYARLEARYGISNRC